MKFLVGSEKMRNFAANLCKYKHEQALVVKHEATMYVYGQLIN